MNSLEELLLKELSLDKLSSMNLLEELSSLNSLEELNSH